MGAIVDPSFIQESEHRPKPTISVAESIPLIDLSPLLTTPIPTDGVVHIPDALSALVAEVEAACRDWGFFQVINHGVPVQLLERVQAVAKEFFLLPLDEKRRVRREEKNFLGYYDTELTKNVRDWKEVFDFAVSEPMVIPASAEVGETETQEIDNRWPEYPPAKRLSGYFKDSISTIRLNHYPPCPSPDLVLGVGRHKDQGALTVLAQDDVGGLDVRRKSDGEWVRVKPIPNS